MNQSWTSYQKRKIMATEGFTFYVPANYTNITVTAVVRGAGGATLDSVTLSSAISAASSPVFTVGATGNTFDTVTSSSGNSSVVSVSSTATGLPLPTTTYTWNFRGSEVANTQSSYSIPTGQTGPLFSTVKLENAAGSTTFVVDFGTVGNTPSFASPPAGTPSAASGSTVGDQLTIAAPQGEGTPSPTYAYAWYLDGVTVAGQNGTTYASAATADAATAIVTATNRHGVTTATINFGEVRENVTLVAPSFLSGPTADARNLTVGDVATVVGAIAGNPTPTISYTWSLDGSPIAGATSSTYTTTATGDSLLAGISASNSEGTITGTADFGSVSAAAGWESFATAKSEIAALSNGATIDFTGRKFAADYADQASEGIRTVANNRSFQLVGGQFSGGRTASWSSVGDGVYAADHNFGDYRSPTLYLVDGGTTTDPLMRINPLPPSDADDYRFVNNGNWVVITGQDGTENGVIQTTGGSGAASQPIIGMQITDSTTKTTINDLIGGVTMDTSGTDVKGPWTLLHTANNIVGAAMITSWDNSTGMMGITGFAGLAPINYNGAYLKMAFCGLPGQTLANGEYCLDFTEGITGGRVLYKPTNGDASDARIPVCDYVFSVGGAGSTISIDGVTIEGCSPRGSAPGAIRDATTANHITIKNCHFSEHHTGLRINNSPATLDKNVMRRMTGRAMAIVAGSEVTNNIIEHIEALSGALIQTLDNSDGVPFTLVENNIFSLESTTHGQGLSLYKNAWRNALIRHNIFYNCQRSHSFQNGGVGSDGNPREECYGYTFENNLVLVNKVLDIDGFPGGQKSISFNGGTDSTIESDGNQTAAFRSNTVVITSNVPDTLSYGAKVQLTSLDVADLRHTSTLLENNIYSIASASLGSNVNGGHTHSNNLPTRINYLNATSTTDKLTHVNPDDVFEPNSFQAKVVSGGAHDGTRTGIRWTAVPTIAQIESIISTDDVNWASTYAGSTLPAQGSYATAVDQVREMGATFGGTAAFDIPWYSSSASYRSTVIPPPDGVTSGALGASGMNTPFSLFAYAPPSYATEFAVINFPSAEHRDTFTNAVSGDHHFKLSVTVNNGGSGSALGQHAATAGHVFNYYWPAGSMQNYVTDAAKLNLSDAATASDEWPNAGITAHLWGPYASINMQGSTASLEPVFTNTLTYSITHTEFGE